MTTLSAPNQADAVLDAFTLGPCKKCGGCFALKRVEYFCNCPNVGPCPFDTCRPFAMRVYCCAGRGCDQTRWL